MSIFYHSLLLLFFAIFNQAAAQNSSSRVYPCVTSCNQRFRPQIYPLASDDVRQIRVGNGTATCPKPLNRTALANNKLDTSCQAVNDLVKCIDECPNDPVKEIVMGMFKRMQLICVNKLDELKKYLPCLINTCPQVQQGCFPKCGAAEDAASNLTTLLQQVNASVAQSGQASAKEATIWQQVTAQCTTISCFLNCTLEQVSKLCGKDSYALQRDFIGAMFSPVGQTVSSRGLGSMLPDQCKDTMAIINATEYKNPATTAMRGDSLDFTTASSLNGSLATSTNATGASTPSFDASRKCEKPPCKGSMSIIPSLVLIFLSVLFAVGSFY